MLISQSFGLADEVGLAVAAAVRVPVERATGLHSPVFIKSYIMVIPQICIGISMIIFFSLTSLYLHHHCVLLFQLILPRGAAPWTPAVVIIPML